MVFFLYCVVMVISPTAIMHGHAHAHAWFDDDVFVQVDVG